MKLFAKLLFALCLLAALSLDLDAQVGEVGNPLVSIDFEPVCDDGTTVFQILQFVVGASAPTSLGYIKGNGAPHTLSGVPEAGPCAGGGGAAAPDYTLSVLTLCDSGTPFYRVAVFTDNTSTPTATADFELDLSTSYTVAGTVYTGPCATTATATLSRSIVTSTGTITAGAFSFEICNEGTGVGTVTIGGATSNLYPGSCTSYSATYNHATRQYKLAPVVTYDGSGTLLAVVVEN